MNIPNKVAYCYETLNDNCATTILKVLAEKFQVSLTQQVLDAATGMHGAGKYQAQCGLVEGGLMFIGILGRHHHLENHQIANHCFNYARQFETKFGSLSCKVLRPGGFKADDPPHLCREITCHAAEFAINFISKLDDMMPIDKA